MIPCKDCLMIPICRHKRYGAQLTKCDLLYSHLYNDANNDKMMMVPNRKSNFDEEILKIQEILKPTQWKTGPFRDGRSFHKYRIVHYHEGKEVPEGNYLK